MSDSYGAVYILAGLLEILIPLGVGFYVTKRLGTSWRTWFAGALMFLLSLTRVPLNAYASQVILSGPITQMTYTLIVLVPSLTAGIFEEIARYIGYRFLIKDDTYEKGVTYGAGHGGIESIFLVGLSVLSIGLALVNSPEIIPPQQLEAMLSAPIYLPFIGLYERIMAMIIQIALSVIVLESIRKSDVKYLGAAVGLHALMDFMLVSIVRSSIFYAEMVATGFALGLGYWTYNKLKDEGVIG
jgi:uncharacterized membrane protein YhfC